MFVIYLSFYLFRHDQHVRARRPVYWSVLVLRLSAFPVRMSAVRGSVARFWHLAGLVLLANTVNKTDTKRMSS